MYGQPMNFAKGAAKMILAMLSDLDYVNLITVRFLLFFLGASQATNFQFSCFLSFSLVNRMEIFIKIFSSAVFECFFSQHLKLSQVPPLKIFSVGWNFPSHFNITFVEYTLFTPFSFSF